MRHFTYPAEKWDEANLDKNIILSLIRDHEAYAKKLARNKAYYDGKHIISDRKRLEDDAPNVMVVCNHAKDIADISTGYFMGNPITYSNTLDLDIDPLLVAFDDAGINDVDADNALDMAIYGCGYEYVYATADNEVVSKNVSAEKTFIITDDTIEENELAGVYYYRKTNSAEHTSTYVAVVGTENYIYHITIVAGEKGVVNSYQEPREDHYFGKVPFIEFLNNKEGIGDFELQISLIDAYNTLMSDRVTDIEQFIDAILVLYGTILGDDEDSAEEALKELKKKKLLEMAADAKAEYLTRQLNQDGVEILRKAIKEDIYNFSHVPNFMDENFAGNTSGVAMEYKLLGLEMLTKTKERYYRKGLRKRIQMYCHYPQLKIQALEEQAGSIIPDFARTLPKNLQELAQVAVNLDDLVSKETLLRQIPFVEDVEYELDKLAEQKQQALEEQQSFFGVPQNNPPEEPENASEDRTEDEEG